MSARTDAGLVAHRAGDLIEAGWCQGSMAAGADGRPRDVWEPEARAFCALGAIRRAADELALGDPTLERVASDASVLERDWLLDTLEHALACMLGGTPNACSGEDSDTVTAWNDREGQSARNVAEALHTLGREFRGIAWGADR